LRRRRSEKVLRQIEQLELQLEELQAAAAIEETQAVAAPERPVAAKPFRRPLPEHLPCEIHIAHASPITGEAIERIAALYAIEAEIRGSTPEIRMSLRQARARPLLDCLHSWLEATLAKLSRKSDTAAAIRYALSRWRALTRYVDDGQLEIDNNAAERALRVVALGRKNSHDRQLCQAWHSELRHRCSFVTGKAREHTRRLLKLSFGRWSPG
jgi:Transposase IS66 family/Transposase C of IS166 homeodomain